MESFKNIEEIMNYDNRFDLFVGDAIFDQSLPSGLKLHHIYDDIKDINLDKDIQEDIQSQFNIAKNIYVYSWYCYPFSYIADLKAISTLEFALRVKFNIKKSLGLKKLLTKAIDNDLIVDSRVFKKLVPYEEVEIKPTDIKVKTINTVKFLCNHRNKLAHGSNSLRPPIPKVFEITADFINQLFKKK